MKKGFTLVELLAVIAIVGILALITTTIVMGSLSSAKDELSKEQVRSIESAARIWGTKNLYVDGNMSNRSFISIQELIDYGVLEKKDYTNIHLDSSSFNEAGVCIKYESNQFVYTYAESESAC